MLLDGEAARPDGAQQVGGPLDAGVADPLVHGRRVRPGDHRRGMGRVEAEPVAGAQVVRAATPPGGVGDVADQQCVAGAQDDHRRRVEVVGQLLQATSGQVDHVQRIVRGAADRGEARAEVERLASRMADQPADAGQLDEHRVARGLVDRQMAGDVGERAPLGWRAREQLDGVDEPFGLRRGTGHWPPAGAARSSMPARSPRSRHSSSSWLNALMPGV